MRPEVKVQKRIRRHQRIRKKIFGTRERPRLCVFRSKKQIYAQIIDDTVGHTLVACSSLTPEIRDRIREARERGEKMSKIDIAFLVGEVLAQRARAKGITKVCFDRGGYKYHGRVKALAEGARKGGLEF
uniref:Large ribosomal subunit protein uL18 n=1 Tax=Caldimicrobium thiodismutans TaxID=1653476 RepID=A0A832LVP7_9BACT